MSEPHQTFVIVGAGQAGGEIANELRKQGYAGRIVIVGDEPHPPYKRPPLSKAFFAGTATEESLYTLAPAALAKLNIEHRPGLRATRIDRVGKHVYLSDGSTLSYDKLALATGGRARALPVPGADLANVFALRSIADVQAIRAQCAPGKHLLIVGGGFIGLEVAAVAQKLDMRVTVLEGLPRVLARVTAPEISAFFERMHREAGVDLRTGAQLAALQGDGTVTHANLVDGTRIDTDLVVYGIGVVPNTELALEAGLGVDNGIAVDDSTHTSDPDIVAAGDCTSHPSHFLGGRRIRLESVQNAMEQARAAALAMLGKPACYEMVPWFWSDQYDLKLQMVGISTGYDRIVLRGDPATQRNFAAFYLAGDKVIAADTVSRPADFQIARKIVAARMVIDPAQLADDSVPLKSLLPEG